MIRHEMARGKSERGAAIAKMLAMPSATCEAIRSIDEHWNGDGMPQGLRADAIPVLSRIVCLAQTVEVFEHDFDVDAAYAVAHARRGRWFDPTIVNCLDAFRDDAMFWADLKCADTLSALARCEPRQRIVYADELRLDTVAEAFAKVIDAKSPFTARHSQNVAFLATRTARELSLPQRDVRAIRRAALLHDVGKLGVSNSVLDKPGPLDPPELAEMRRHTAYTFDILRQVNRFQRFALLASSHHERLDGNGVPSRTQGLRPQPFGAHPGGCRRVRGALGGPTVSRRPATRRGDGKAQRAGRFGRAVRRRGRGIERVVSWPPRFAGGPDRTRRFDVARQRLTQLEPLHGPPHSHHRPASTDPVTSRDAGARRSPSFQP